MILSNQVRCHSCNDTPYSANRHDYKSCKCGAIAVDGGMDYLRRVGDIRAYDEMSIEINDTAYGHTSAAITQALKSGRNELGILCAVARTLRDNGVAIFNVPVKDPITPNSDEECDLEQACFYHSNTEENSVEVRQLVAKLWAEVMARETAVVAQQSTKVQAETDGAA